MNKDKNNDHCPSPRDDSNDSLVIAREKKNEMLRVATDMLASKGHASTQYPPQWMPSPTLVDKLPRVFWTLFCIMFNALFTWLSIVAEKRSTLTALTAIYPSIIIATALWFCFGFPLEYVEKLNFGAVQILVLGAFFNLVFGENNFLTQALISEKVGSFIGTSILSLGTIVVSSVLIVDLLSTLTAHVLSQSIACSHNSRLCIT